MRTTWATRVCERVNLSGGRIDICRRRRCHALHGDRMFRAYRHIANCNATSGISFFHWVQFLYKLIYTIVNQIGFYCNRSKSEGSS